MKLNKDWQQQWDSIEVPEEKIDTLIRKELDRRPKISNAAKKKFQFRDFFIRNRIPVAVIGFTTLIIAIIAINTNHISYENSMSKQVEERSEAGSGKTELYRAPDEATNDDSIAAVEGDGKMVLEEGSAAGAKASASNEKEADKAKPENGVTTKANPGDKTAFFYNVIKETTNFDDDLEAVEQLTEANQGYIASSTIEAESEYSENRFAYFTLKIPSEQKGAFLEELLKIGNTVNQNVRSENYSLEYSDNESRIAALETEEKALLDLLGKSETIEDMLKIQERLSIIRSERESLVKSNRSIDNQVDYTSITIELNEITKIQKNSKSQSANTKIKNNWQKQVKYWQELATNLWISFASNVVYLMLIFGIAIIAVIVYLKKRKTAEKPLSETNHKK